MSRPITPAQKTYCIQLLNRNRLMGDRASVLLELTDGRTGSLKELTMAEAAQLITYLQGNNSADTMRKKIIGLARDMDWDKDQQGNRLSNAHLIAAINRWCSHHGQYHKALDAHTQEQLPALVSQFEQVHASHARRLASSR
jgi:hypothetical protein